MICRRTEKIQLTSVLLIFLCFCHHSWVVDTFFYDSNIAQILQLGIYRSKAQQEQQQQQQNQQSPIIDVTTDRSQPIENNMVDIISKNALSKSLRQLPVDRDDRL